jgi:23S rRNA-/tRNA-specific pseudouridylate synthase
MSASDAENAFARTLPLASGVRLIKAECGIIALDKPDGVRAHPNESGKADRGALLTVPFDMEKECYLLPDGAEVHLLHRIDAPTSGILLLSADKAVAEKVRELFAKHLVHKTYEALVFGDAGRGTRTWRDRLRTERGKGGARTSAGEGDMSVTEARAIEVVRAENAMCFTRLALDPQTGRTHQLRVQCATRKLPIVGDATYGNFAWNRLAAKELGIKRLCLHAAAVQFEMELRGRKVSFSAKCPAPQWLGKTGRSGRK